MNKQKSNRGFSLIELLICIAILAIIMVMISSFVSTTLISNRKTKKELQVQDESQRIFYQVADIMMQATYIRVAVEDGSKVYEYNLADREFNEIDTVDIAAGAVDLVPDNYANYEADLGYDSQKVIVDLDKYDILNEKGEVYPKACTDLLNAVKKIDSSKTALVDADAEPLVLKSFRTLTRQYKKKVSTGTTESGGSNAEIMKEQIYSKSYYIVPKYIYVEYSRSKTESTTEAGTDKVTDTATDVGCVIFKFDSTAHKIYMYRAPDSKNVPEDIDYQEAKDAIDATGYDSYISDNIADFYFSADPDSNAISLAMTVENEKYKGYRYNMNETINIRNSNVLTVKPQLLRKKKGTGEPKTETITSK